MLKQKVVSFSRAMRIIPALEWVHFGADMLHNRRDNRLFRLQHPDFVPPPYRAMHDAYASVSYRSYWDGGKITAIALKAIIDRHSPEPDGIMEWGCGPARVIRHFPEIFPHTRLAGADYNRESISWCKRALPGIDFSDNNLSPPLPFPSSRFDVIYALSVLTHLSGAQQINWLKELCRVLKRPSGCLILTTHGERCQKMLLPEERDKLAKEGIITRSGVQEGKRCFVSYNTAEYMRGVLFTSMTIAEHITDHPDIAQDIWIVKP